MNHQFSNSSYEKDVHPRPDYGSQTAVTENFFIAPIKPAIAQRELSEIQNVLSKLDQQNELNSKMAIPTERGLEFVVIKEIIRCEACQKYTKVFTTTRKPILSSFNIGRFINFLAELKNFFLSHKSHLVNLNHIEYYSRDGVIRMTDNSLVPVSVRNRASFMNAINTV